MTPPLHSIGQIAMVDLEFREQKFTLSDEVFNRLAGEADL